MNITPKSPREITREKLPVITAFSEGKTIQRLDGTGRWVDTDTPDWRYDQHRIKPELREFWIVDGCGGATCYSTLEEAREWHSKLAHAGVRLIHVREVAL